VIGLYLLANVAYLVVLPLKAIQQAPRTAWLRHASGHPSRLRSHVDGRGDHDFTFGCVNSLVLAGARAYYAMAKDGLFFARAGVLNKAHVPAGRC